MKCPGTVFDAVKGVLGVSELTDSVELAYVDTDHGDSDERLINPAQSLREAPW